MRIKQLSIDEIVREKRDWMDKYDMIPFDSWLAWWHFLLRKLNHYSEIERNQNFTTSENYQDEESEPDTNKDR